MRDCHFGWDLNDENAYFVAIPMAIICEVAFLKSITPRLPNHFSRQIKSFSKKWIKGYILMCLGNVIVDPLFR